MYGKKISRHWRKSTLIFVNEHLTERRHYFDLKKQVELHFK